MKKERANRYLVCLDMSSSIPADLTPSERLILMFLKLHYNEQMRGATKEQIMNATGMSLRTFERSWKTLNQRNLVMSERLYALTHGGLEIAKQLTA